MLDRLLGRAELKERIAELEEEKRHLERQLDAEQDRRADAVSDRQDAEREVNRLEDRVAELEDRVDRLTSDEDGVEFRRVSDAGPDRTRDLLDRLRGVEAAPEGAFTAYVPDGDTLPLAVTDHFGEHAELVRRAAPAVVVADDAGLVSAALRPAVPPETFHAWDDAFRLEASWFCPTGRFAFALLRSDTFAVGTYEGDERVAFEGFASDVKGAHSKGGFSQGRFERRREGQIDEHVSKATDELAAVADDVDRVIVVGERSVLGEVRDLADVTSRSDATGKPEAALDDAFHDFWTTRVYGI